ncbi:MAG TPA: dienelactone hydrolase [Actinobacteria bacterium]|jgi:carboxymethylenebutenolidase|nr:dienelactone hydrolase [Actinomycetota bacterium]
MQNTTVRIGQEDVPAVLAIPESGAGPAVIVIQEWWGLVPHIVDVTERLAREGFVAMAVDHYRGAATTEPDEAQKLMLGLDIHQVAVDLDAAAAELLSRPEVTSSAVCVIGFCMGGGLALLAPTVSGRIDGAAAFYPAMPWPQYAPDWSQYAGKSAIVHKAESDEPGNGPAIAAYAEAITAAGGSIELFEYPGSVHAFFNDDRPEVFQADHAALAWQRTLDFLRRCAD